MKLGTIIVLVLYILLIWVFPIIGFQSKIIFINIVKAIIISHLIAGIMISSCIGLCKLVNKV